jgi:hypothetical protein
MLARACGNGYSSIAKSSLEEGVVATRGDSKEGDDITGERMQQSFWPLSPQV